MKILAYAALVGVSLLIGTVLARTAEIDFSHVLLDMDDQPIKEADKVLTLGRVAVMALTYTLPEDSGLSGEEKFKRGQLAARVYGGNTVQVSVEEIALIKKLIGRTFNPVVVLRAYPLLDPPKQ